jgi:hypothetical protein
MITVSFFKNKSKIIMLYNMFHYYLFYIVLLKMYTLVGTWQSINLELDLDKILYRIEMKFNPNKIYFDFFNFF